MIKIMKLKSLLFSALAVVALAAGCQKEGGLGGDPSIKLDKKTVTIKKGSESVTVKVTSNRDWKLEMSDSDKEWAHTTITKGEASAKPVPVTITCDENTGRERTASIKFTTGSYSTTLKITQEGAVSTNYVSCKSLTTLAAGTPIDENTFIKVQVISNYELNNLSTTKAVYAQDVLAEQKGKPGTGVQIKFASAPTVAVGEVTRNLKCGDIIELEVSGFTPSVYQDAIQLDANGKTPQPVLLTSAEDADELVPVEISIEDFLNGKYENQYVKIKESVQVADTDLSKTWADPAGKSHFSINMETADGKVFVVFTSSYCGQLKNTQVAQGSGQICGIASINNGTYQLIFAKATDADALNGDRFTAQIHVLTVDKALAARNVLASVSGRVIAACAEGVVINDGSANNLYVYNASYKTKPFEFKVGDIVKADGSLTTYCKVAELKVDAEKALTADLAIEETPAQVTTVITPENIATWLPSPAGSAKVSVSGKLVISGSYINLEIDGATIQGSIKTSRDLSEFKGKYVSCTGYWVGTTSNYFTIVETEVTEDASDRLSVSAKELNVAANATTASFDIASTVDWTVTSKTEGVTVDPTSGNGDATITLTFAENTSDQPKVATIEVSSTLGTETITLTQKAYVPAGAMAELTNEEIVAAYKAKIAESGFKAGYQEVTVESKSGIWTGFCNVGTSSGALSTTYMQFNTKNGQHVQSPVFEKEIAKIELELAKSTYTGCQICVVPSSLELPASAGYNDTQYSQAYASSVAVVDGGEQTVTIDIPAETVIKDFKLIAKGKAGYINSIKVYFKE